MNRAGTKELSAEARAKKKSQSGRCIQHRDYMVYKK
nr:MAG TPA: hypothetical protein [Caudoviricetes sp.]